MWTRRQFLKTLGTIPLVGVAQTVQLPSLEMAFEAAADGIRFSDGGSNSFGDWRADVLFSPASWNPGTVLDLELFLHLSSAMAQALAAGNYPIGAVLMLVTSERCFDIAGWLRLPSDDRLSTLITPTGLAIEGGSVGAVSKSVGSRHRNPVDQLRRIPASQIQQSSDSSWVRFALSDRNIIPDEVILPLGTTGKKLKIHDTNQLVDRGESHYEGYIEPNDGLRNLDHIDFPYNAGDVLLIASEGDGANKIEPVLTYEIANSGQGYDPKIQPIGATNVRIATSNRMSPHMYPEYITDMAYYYGAGPRPGFMSRFLVGEDGVRGPYWPTSSTNFGGQIGASNNGDMPGTPYRLLGGVVLRKKDQTPMYGGFVASAFIMPKGTNNNRVIAPGAEDLLGADGQKFRFYLVSLRPGMVYEAGTPFVPVFQIDPILPVHINCKLWRDGVVLKE